MELKLALLDPDFFNKIWLRASQNPRVPSITVLPLQCYSPMVEQGNYEMTRNWVYVSYAQLQCLDHNTILLLNQSYLVLVIQTLIDEVLYKQQSASIRLKAAVSWTIPVLMASVGLNC